MFHQLSVGDYLSAILPTALLVLCLRRGSVAEVLTCYGSSQKRRKVARNQSIHNQIYHLVFAFHSQRQQNTQTDPYGGDGGEATQHIRCYHLRPLLQRSRHVRCTTAVQVNPVVIMTVVITAVITGCVVCAFYVCNDMYKVCVCVYMCKSVCVCVSVHASVCVCMCECVHACVCVCVHVLACVCVCVWIVLTNILTQ